MGLPKPDRHRRENWCLVPRMHIICHDVSVLSGSVLPSALNFLRCFVFISCFSTSVYQRGLLELLPLICRYGVSPFEYSLGESGGSLQLAAMSGQIKWPPGPNPPYPDSLHKFVTWMLQPNPALRPNMEDVCIHVEKLVAKFPTGMNGLWTLQNP